MYISIIVLFAISYNFRYDISNYYKHIMVIESQEQLDKALLTVYLNNFQSMKDFLGLNYNSLNDNFLIESKSKNALEEIMKSVGDSSLQINSKGSAFTLEINPGDFVVSDYFFVHTCSMQENPGQQFLERQSTSNYRQWAVNLASFFETFEISEINIKVENHPQMSERVFGSIMVMNEMGSMFGIYAENSNYQRSIN